MKNFMRQVDHVLVKGGHQPTGFFSIDMDIDSLPPSKDPNEQNLDKIERILIEKEKKETLK